MRLPDREIKALGHPSCEGNAVGMGTHCVTVPAAFVSGGLFGLLLGTDMRKLVDIARRYSKENDGQHAFMLATARTDDNTRRGATDGEDVHGI